MGKLSGKIALITGGGSGIGKATAILFASEGAKVMVADYAGEGAKETVRAIKDSKGEATSVTVDVSRSTDVEQMIKATISTYGRLDIMFNNAGIDQPATTIAETTEDVFDAVVRTNLKGVFLGIKHGIPAMLEKGGVIINTASISGLLGFPRSAVYGATKAGIIALTKTAALEYASHNIRVNCICPGPIQTPLFDRKVNDPQYKAASPLRSPAILGRLGTPQEIAQAALFLASDESASYVTGAALVIDGGYSAL